MLHSHQILQRLATSLATLTVLAGCASGPKLYTNEDPAADFSGYRTYAFEAVLGTDRPGYTSLLSQYIKSAVQREMDLRGYTLSETNPDLYINFYIHTKEKIRTTQTPTTGGYYGYRGSRYGTWGGYTAYETQVTQYTEGTFNLDLIEARRDQLVWEGTMVGRIKEDTMENLRPRVDAAVATMFEQYPYRAGS